jgi:hypothetical protein
MEETMDEIKKKRLEFWVRFWAAGLVVQGLSAFLISAPLDSIVIMIAAGLALGWGKRVRMVLNIVLVFSFYLVGATLTWFYVHRTIRPDMLRQAYFLVCAMFDLGLFVFLWQSDAKRLFPKPFAPAAPPVVLTSAEKQRYKLIINAFAFFLLLEGASGFFFRQWYVAHGFPEGSQFELWLGLIASVGLFTRTHLGRAFALATSFLAGGGSFMIIFRKEIFGFGYLYTGLAALLYVACFIYLLHPKVKALFRQTFASHGKVPGTRGVE